MATVLPSVSSSIIALWAGVDIGSSKAKKMLKNCVLNLDNDISISPEYIFFKFQLLKKFGFNDEAENTADSYISAFSEDCKANGAMVGNSLACALYLYLLNERSK